MGESSVESRVLSVVLCRPKSPTLAGQLRRSIWPIPAVPAPWGPPPRTHGTASQAQGCGVGTAGPERGAGYSSAGAATREFVFPDVTALPMATLISRMSSSDIRPASISWAILVKVNFTSGFVFFSWVYVIREIPNSTNPYAL